MRWGKLPCTITETLTLNLSFRMGKTIQMIALLVSDKGAKPNLVVAYVFSTCLCLSSSRSQSPTVAVMQWKNEIETHSTGMDVLVWHGAARDNNIKTLKKYDVVRFERAYISYMRF